MKRIMTLAVVISLFLPPATLFAKERRGAQIVIKKTDGTKIEGELIAIKQYSKLLFESSSGIGESIDVSDVRSIKIVKESLARLGVVLGILIGGVAGVSIGSGGGDPQTDRERIGAFFGGFFGGGAGALAGGLFGGLVGSSVHATDEFLIEGKSQDKITAYLEELRSKARFPDYQ